MAKKVWTHKSHGKKKFKGNYVKVNPGKEFGIERIFNLSHTDKNGKVRNISFESPRAAKEAGWKAE